MKLFFTSVRLFIILTIFCGVAYPIAVTVCAQTFFRDAANGSLVRRGGEIAGSALLGQNFTNNEWFHGRPSATAPQPYVAFDAAGPTGSTGSNLGPLNPALRDRVNAAVAELLKSNPDAGMPVPLDLVTASASGLDPHVSPAGARFQAARVARARGASVDAIRALIDECVEPGTFGILGEPRVNVLRLNLLLDERFPLRAPR